MNKELRNQKLEEAKQLILKGWCQKSSARDVDGEITSCLANEAISFCALGAVCRVTGMNFGAPSRVFDLHDLAKEMGYKHAIDFNDTPGRTIEEVAEFFDKLKERPYVCT